MRNDQPNKGNRMTKERLEDLHEIRHRAWALWDDLLSYRVNGVEGLDFIDADERREMRAQVLRIADAINDHICDEFGVTR